MTTKKVTLKEFKEIVKNMIKEEMEKLPKVDTKDKQKVINQLKGVYKYSQQEAEKLVNDHPDMNATAIHKKIKDAKLEGGK
jgi:2-oxo-4-hydroxy-4-carboxy--5-ureidoimidazoline (OHCU) decarboxylase